MDKEYWQLIDGSRDSSPHYRIMKTRLGMEALRAMFPDGEADSLNMVLFSTSGVHGTYSTIEEAESDLKKDEYAEVTFLVIHPRLVALRYGNCQPENQEDIEFLKKLRHSSHKMLVTIGVDNE